MERSDTPAITDTRCGERRRDMKKPGGNGVLCSSAHGQIAAMCKSISEETEEKE